MGTLAPLLLACWLCCWPDTPRDAGADDGEEPARRRRPAALPARRIVGSTTSLRLPAGTGQGRPPAAHRSHEEIARRKWSQGREPAARYHSAPSVIDEVLHRRDWQRSAGELRAAGPSGTGGVTLACSPLATGESSVLGSPPATGEPSVAGSPLATGEPSVASSPPAGEARACKKHHSNIKRSKRQKEREADDDKDSDATEGADFYIGDNSSGAVRPAPRAKEAKQSLNESIRSARGTEREGAARRSPAPRAPDRAPGPPPSVEPVGYEGGACYLAERGTAAAMRGRPPALRGRHASDGDILAPPLRPESGAFSESDLEPPLAAPARRETAI